MKVYPPSENLGCLGFRINSKLYFDFYKSPCLGMFINLAYRKIWIHKNGFKAQLKHSDVLFRLYLDRWERSIGMKHLIVH